MKVVRYHSYGDPSVLRLEDAPVPVPSGQELLVEVGAIGVTLPAVRQVRGGPASALPATVGGEVSGVVTAIGPSVTGFAAGDRVTGLSFSGSYGSFALVPAPLASRVPAWASDTLAVALLRSGQVASGVLAAAGSGSSVLVTGAASGVGHLLVQLARRAGFSTVIGAVGSAGKTDFVSSFGVPAVTYAAMPPASVDVVLDGAGLLGDGLACLRPGGRMVFFASGGGTLPAYDLLAGGLTVTGFSMGRFARSSPEAYAAQSSRLWELARTESLRVAIDSTFPLAEAASAHRRIEARENRGKVVLIP